MKKKIFSITLHEHCIGVEMRYLIIYLCLIFYVYAQDSGALKWQDMDCKELNDLLIKSYGFAPQYMDDKTSLCQGGLQKAQKVFINPSDISNAYKQWCKQDRDAQMLDTMPLVNTNIALYKDMNITPYTRYLWKDSKMLIVEEEYECNEANGTYPIGRHIIFQQIRDKVLIVEIHNQVC